MQLYFASGFRLFLPVVFPTDETLNWSSIKLLHLLEIVFIIVACPGAVLLVYALGKSVRLFHINLIRIAQVHVVAFTVSQISRIIILLFEAGFLKKKIERALASLYIRDYESVKRLWISVLVNATSLLVSTLYYVLMQLIAFSLYAILFLVAMAVIIFTLSSLSIMMVYRRDVAKLRDLSDKTGRSTINYTLSMKFQLAENIRVAKLLTHASIGVSILGTSLCCLCSPPFLILGEEKPISHLLYAVSNVVIAVSFTITVWLCLIAFGEIRRIYKRTYASFCCMSRKARKLLYPVHTVDVQEIADKHFEQLRTAWKTTS
ncbi:unnamed protein product [Cylicocyclus nassatus]|uniref:Uncharacterized protein n=1 Tax=Cylicocyclus nassatus TaxID=53992 RepID=A0AA36HD45_CYLNA|nr:unnamed protein product [Cylicocyclus nassatus]